MRNFDDIWFFHKMHRLATTEEILEVLEKIEDISPVMQSVLLEEVATAYENLNLKKF